ncbi:MAG: CRISPR-associated endonuclease Cas1 [Anaerolineae bacterium]
MSQFVVNTQGSRLHKEGERLIVRHEDDPPQEVPLGPLEQVVLCGRGVSVSTPLLYELVRRGIDVVYQSQSGRYAFRVVGPLSKHSALRVQQVLAVSDPARALPLARAVVVGKLHNQAVVLHSYADGLDRQGRRRLAVLAQQMRQAQESGSVDALRGHEGSGAAAYFAAWPSLFDAERWGFEGRAYHPPPDPVNAMLGFGYTLLLNEIVGALYRIGLDPDVGFFHTLDYGRPSLALDLEEEFRAAVVDRLVLRLLREADLDPAVNFEQRNGRPGSLMTDQMRAFFLARYEEQMAVRVGYPALGNQHSYRQLIERQAEHLARCFLGQDEAYVPLEIR